MAGPRAGSDRLRTDPETKARELVSPAVLGTLIFVIAEVMLFMGLMSAFMIVKAGSPAGWPPPNQPRLPIEATLFNSLALLLSGAFLAVAQRRLRRDKSKAWGPLLGAIVLGAFFVIFQGVEWVRMVGEGLTLTSSSLGGFFYLVVGLHGLHAIAALIALGIVLRRLMRQDLRSSNFHASALFWYFVVGMWPYLYFQVYL